MEFVTVKQIKHFLNMCLAGTVASHLILCLRCTAQGNNTLSHVGWAQQGTKHPDLSSGNCEQQKKINKNIGIGGMFQ